MLVPLPLCVLCVGVGGLFKGTYWKEAVVWYLSSGMSFISWISNIFVIKLYAPFVLILLGRGVGGLFKGNFWEEAVLYLSSAANNKWTSDFPSPDWDPGSRLCPRKIHNADSAGHKAVIWSFFDWWEYNTYQSICFSSVFDAIINYVPAVILLDLVELESQSAETISNLLFIMSPNVGTGGKAS